MHAYTRRDAGIIRNIVVILGALAMSGCGNASGPRGTLQPTPSDRVPDNASSAAPTAITIPALSETFESRLHGYIVRHPAGWTVTQASKPWVGAALLWGDPAQDDLLGSDVRLVAASQALPAGQTAQQWLAEGSAVPACNGTSRLPAQVSVGGAIGIVTLNGCKAAPDGIASGGVIYDILVVVENRGYDFTVDGIVDAAYVQALLATVTFQPALAVDPSPAPS